MTWTKHQRFFLFLILIHMISGILLGNPMLANAMSLEKARSIFEAANTAYRDGEYVQSQKLYAELVDSDRVSAAVYFNLGNAHFRLKQPGRATLFYEKALRLAPRDSDIRFNLRFVREQLNATTMLDKRRGVLGLFWQSMVRHVNVNEMTLITVGWLLVVAILLLLKLLRTRYDPFINIGTLIGLIMVIVTAFGIIFQERSYQNKMIVFKPIEVRFEPKPEATVHYQLEAGSQIELHKVDRGWLKIKRADGLMGWIPETEAGKIDS